MAKKPIKKSIASKVTTKAKSAPAKSKPPAKLPKKQAAQVVKKTVKPSKPAVNTKKLTPAKSIPSQVLSLNVQSSPGAAAHSNTHPANILVIVSAGGIPVNNLQREDFIIKEHFTVPGQQGTLSNNITSFNGNEDGAYLIQVKPTLGAVWCSGHHLIQIIVKTANGSFGQAGTKILIR
jgi:hypothetical protein